MFKINQDTKQINITRGDYGIIDVSTINEEDGSDYIFQIGDIVRLKVYEKNDCNSVILQKDIEVKEITEVVSIELLKEDTTIGDIVSNKVDYWYEVVLNPNTKPHTIVGYDEDKAKIFRLYPKGATLNDIN